MDTLKNRYTLLLSMQQYLTIPVYQRSYSWMREQCERLFDDVTFIMNASIASNVPYTHFTGTIFLVARNDQNAIIIDGQQRLTTMSLFFLALSEVYREKGLEKEGETLYHRLVCRKPLNSSDAPEKGIFLVLGEIDNAIYKRLCLRDFPSENEAESLSKLYKNYSYFHQALLEQCEGKNAATVLKCYEQALSQLTFIQINVHEDAKEEDPQLIFESINSTGLELTHADRVRNYLLMSCREDKQLDLYKHYWVKIDSMLHSSATVTTFLRDYLTMQNTKVPHENFIYNEFKKYAEGQRREHEWTSDLMRESLLKSLYRYAAYDASIVFAHKPLQEREQMFSDIYILSHHTVPLLLMLKDLYATEKLQEKELVSILSLLSCYLVRGAIVYKDDFEVTIKKVVLQLCKILRVVSNGTDLYLNAIKNYISSELGSDAHTAMPKDEAFSADFKNLTVSHANKDMVSFLLSSLMLYNSKQNKEALVDLYGLELVQIMPDKPNKAWSQTLGPQASSICGKNAHNIGNFIVNDVVESSSEQRESFEEWKHALAESSCVAIRKLAKKRCWDAAAIEANAQVYADLALAKWPFPFEHEPAFESKTFAALQEEEVSQLPAEETMKAQEDSAEVQVPAVKAKVEPPVKTLKETLKAGASFGSSPAATSAKPEYVYKKPEGTYSRSLNRVAKRIHLSRSNSVRLAQTQQRKEHIAALVEASIPKAKEKAYEVVMGELTKPVDSLSDLLVTVCEYLLDNYTSLFVNMMASDDRIAGRGRYRFKRLSENPNDLRSPRRINDSSIYVDVQGGFDVITQLCQHMWKHCVSDGSELRFNIHA